MYIVNQRDLEILETYYLKINYHFLLRVPIINNATRKLIKLLKLGANRKLSIHYQHINWPCIFTGKEARNIASNFTFQVYHHEHYILQSIFKKIRDQLCLRRGLNREKSFTKLPDNGLLLIIAILIIYKYIYLYIQEKLHKQNY